MALTQQFARVTPEYLERCRDTALGSPGAAPGWSPPPTDLFDTDWAIWDLIHWCRSDGTAPDIADLLAPLPDPSYLAQHLTTMRDFFRGAALLGQCVVVRAD